MTKACVFDLDGTLVNTLPSLTWSVGETLKKLNLPPIDEKTCSRFIGDGARKLLERSLRYAGGDPKTQLNEALDIYYCVFKEGCLYQVSAYNGVPSLLETLKKKGIKLAVFSNKPHAETRKVTETVFGTGLFSDIEGQKDDVPRKPDPAGLWDVLASLDVKKEETLYIGDSEVDVATGKAADLTTLCVTWGFRSKQTLLDSGAEFLLDSPKEILDFITEERRIVV